MSPPSAGLLAWLLGKGVCLFCILSKLQPGKHTSSVWFMILWKCETLVVILCMIQNSSKSCQQKLYSFNRTTGTTNYHVRRQLNNYCKMKALKIRMGWIIICWVGRSGRDRGSPIYSVIDHGAWSRHSLLCLLYENRQWAPPRHCQWSKCYYSWLHSAPDISYWQAFIKRYKLTLTLSKSINLSSWPSRHMGSYGTAVRAKCRQCQEDTIWVKVDILKETKHFERCRYILHFSSML